MHAKTVAEKKLEKLYKNHNWKQARNMILELINNDSKNHFLWTRLASVQTELHDTKNSLLAAKKAYQLKPNCPLVCWDYGNILSANGHEKQGLSVLNKILRMGTAASKGDCGQGVRDSRRLRNDARYIIGICYYNLGKKNLSKKFIDKHIQARKKGVKSFFPLKIVKTWLYWPEKCIPNDVPSGEVRRR